MTTASEFATSGAWIDLDKIKQLSKLGLNQREIAACLGVSPDTWYRFIRAGRSDITYAYKAGQMEDAVETLTLLREAANEKNVRALIFKMKSRHKRRENIDPDVLENEDLPLQRPVLTKDQREARIRELLAKRESK